MKKWFIGLLVIASIIIAGIYVLIPRQIKLSQITRIQVTANGARKYLMDTNNWHKWWPGITDTAAKVFTYNNIVYKFDKGRFNNAEIILAPANVSLSSFINIIPLQKDSIALQWQCVINSGATPAKKIQQYLLAKKIKDDFNDIANALKSFLENKQNIYSIHIQKTIVQDSFLVAIKSVSEKYPATADVYSLIDLLKEYIVINNANETNNPMLNIMQIDSNHYETMVAIPVNKELAGNKNIFFKRLQNGNLLMTEIKGGVYTINHALAELEIFKNDYELISPAIPFSSLVTNRLLEPDTTKWVTRIYYPIF